jgi:hypothetical protein
MSRARWSADALDLSATPDKISEYLTVGQLSDATGLAEATLRDSLTREVITNESNPRGALCRPAAHFGNEPLWSTIQLAEYKRRVAVKEGKADELPLVTATEAEERGLVSTAEIAEMFGLHDQTLRSAQAKDGKFPAAVARRSRGGRPGVPEHVRPLDQVLPWAEARGYTRVPASA